MISARFWVPLLTVLTCSGLGRANEKTDKSDPPNGAIVEQLAARAKKSLVVILYTGRDGRQVGLGTGFLLDDTGLVATNFHVIGEARPITVQLPDGSKHEVTSVHASDRNLDLAIVKIELAKAKAKDLAALPLGDSEKLKIGQPIVALGHPRGLEYSVVAGVLSGKRDVDGISMLQVAIPIEQGNSGGPVLDMQGRVVGVVSMKSLVTANLGFAVPVNALKSMLAKPNPIPMERWLTIGALDKSDWKTLLGGRWRQRAGRIIADGAGTGFGGRSLCYWLRDLPQFPYELTVTVKLDDEAGAAGLIFGGDGAHKHYGFYPSGGKLRLTRFNGPDVLTWKILNDVPNEHYRSGEWNTLKVRLEKDKFSCFINDQLAFEHTDPDYPGFLAGLAKFRETVAEFKKFQAAEKIAPVGTDPKTAALLDKLLASLKDKAPSADDLDPRLRKAEGSIGQLRDKARQLEKQAAQLRKLAQAVHQQRCLDLLSTELKQDEAKIDLARAALIVAQLDNEELDIDVYRKEIDRLAREIAGSLPKDASPAKKRQALDAFLFKERGFHGSRMDYYSRNNSYLNEVIDDREGLPITLSVLYMELARRLGLTVAGVALPGHFVVRDETGKGPGQLIDVYEGGKDLTDKDAEDRVLKITGRPLEKKDLAAVSKKAIVLRMLHNLINVSQNEKDRDGMLRYLDAIVAVAPESHEERWARAVFRFQAGLRDAALADCDFLINAAPPDTDLDRVRELRKLLLRDR